MPVTEVLLRRRKAREEERRAVGTATYAYDPAGNRTSEVTVSGATAKSYAYPAANSRLAS
jgi:hypothetical protein